MLKKNIIKERSYCFAISICKLYKHLSTDNNEFVLSKQLLRSGTSIGANIREALNAESRSDFIHKLGIAQKECDESIYWIELLKDSGQLKYDSFKIIHDEAEELLRIIKSIILSSKQNQQSL